jgi:hypothetical protein
MFSINVKKAAASYEVDFDGLPEVSRNRVIIYGLTQLLSDAAASVPMSADIEGRKVPLKGKDLATAIMNAKTEVEKRLTDLQNGVLRRVRTASGDPVEARARQLAIRAIQKDPDFRAWVAKAGVKFTDETATEELAKRATALVESNPKLRIIAARQIEDEAGLMIDESEGEAKAA